ncbi:MAG: hypothetical protein ABIF85_03455 [Nanoarchaeota archaeon]|nr:hypothetical protein [Nanoarchaeota archaeon]MCG2723718.1 hypothetical protein [archaeon]
MNKKILIFAAVLFIAIVAVLIIQHVPPQMPEKINNTLSSDWADPKNDLSKVKVAVLYQNIIDEPPLGPQRSTGDVIRILNETHADMVFRSFWRWLPAFDSPENIPPEIVKEYAERTGIKPEQIPLLVEKSGYNYQELEKRISAIKREMPNVIFVGAIPAQRINRIDKNDITGKVYTTNETWAMALDPQKWSIQKNGKPFTKEEFQAQFAGWHGWAKSENYDYREVEAYFPDITNPDYQGLLLSWAKRQIDAGADAIWIDGLPQTSLFYPFVKDTEHPIIKDLFSASEKIINEIHRYGESKGKRIYVGAWAVPFKYIEGLPQMPSSVDFVTMTPTENEILNKKLDESYEKISRAKRLYDNTPIFAFIDWSMDISPTVDFSQKLNKKEQSGLLQTLDDSFAKNGVNFIYPLHGGYMGPSAKRLAFGKYRNYDSLAPEFNTYETIKELANKKAAK